MLKKLIEYSTFSSVAFDTFAMRPSFHQVKFEMGDAFGLTIDLPRDTATIPFATMTPDFILFLQDLAIGTERVNDGSVFGKNETYQSPESGYCSYSLQSAAGSFNYGPPPMSSPMPQMFFYPSTPKSKYLRYKCGFAFWDNRKHRVAAYGKIFSKSKADSYGLGVVEIIRIANWQEIDDRFVQSILWGTPFRR